MTASFNLKGQSFELLLPRSLVLSTVFEMSATSSPSIQLPAYKGSTVRVSILFAGSAVLPTAMLVQPPIAGHDTMDTSLYSFLVENEVAGKKMLFDLGFMKAWKEKLPPLRESLRAIFFLIALWRDGS